MINSPSSQSRNERIALLDRNFSDRSEAAKQVINRKMDFFDNLFLMIFVAILMLAIIGSYFIRYYENVDLVAKIRVLQTKTSFGYDSVVLAEVRVANPKLIPIGSDVKIILEGYSYETFGFVTGKLAKSSKHGLDSLWTGIIEIQNGLLTSRKRRFLYHDGMQAQAIIRIEDRFLNMLYKKIILKSSH